MLILLISICISNIKYMIDVVTVKKVLPQFFVLKKGPKNIFFRANYQTALVFWGTYFKLSIWWCLHGLRTGEPCPSYSWSNTWSIGSLQTVIRPTLTISTWVGKSIETVYPEFTKRSCDFISMPANWLRFEINHGVEEVDLFWHIHTTKMTRKYSIG